jgi:hypothetical protein
MLTEIFQTIGDDLFQYLESRNIKTKKIELITGRVKPGQKKKAISFELLRFGSDQVHKNYLPEASPDKSYYAFSFFVIAHSPLYTDRLEMVEHICDHLHKKPFLQIRIKEKEFEVAFSALELNISELSEFWLVQSQPYQPVLFYQARISEI